MPALPRDFFLSFFLTVKSPKPFILEYEGRSSFHCRVIVNAFDPDLVTIALLFFDAFGSIESRGRPGDNESQRDETLGLLV